MLKTVAAFGLSTTLMFSSAIAQAQQKWDMPTGYPTSNFHTANIQLFAKDVE